MGRQQKAYETRRNEILDGAWALFTQHGYEGTTVSSIIEKLNISKGTFYHYFQSKEQVLDAVTDRLSEDPLADLKVVAQDETLTAIPKFNRFMEVARRSRLERIDAVISVARVLYREENLIIRHKITERLTTRTLPLLQSIIEQGVEEGCFHVTDAVEATNFLWIISNTLGDQQMQTLLSSISPDQKVEKMVSRAKFISQSLEKMLGLASGTIPSPGEEILRQFVNAMGEEGREAHEQ